MDYTNFVKTYYRTAVSKLNQYSSFSGTFNTVNYRLNIKADSLHTKVSNLDILPNYDLNINASLDEYEKFMSYYIDVYPELNGVFLKQETLYNAYKLSVSKSIANDEQKSIEFIDLLIDISINVLLEKGLLK